MFSLRYKMALPAILVLLVTYPFRSTFAQGPDKTTVLDTFVINNGDQLCFPVAFLDKGEHHHTGSIWEYRLDYTDEEWKATGPGGMKISNVPTGEHILRFRRKNAAGYENMISILLISKPSFNYGTLVSAMLIILSALAVIGSFTGHSGGRLKRKQGAKASSGNDLNPDSFNFDELSAPENTTPAPAIPGPTPHDTEWLVQFNQIVITTMVQGEISGEQLAAQMYISRSRLFHKIRHLTGMSLSQYIMEQRLQHARMILEQKKCLTVKAVALSVGLRHVNHFSKKYKERFGKLPSAYF